MRIKVHLLGRNLTLKVTGYTLYNALTGYTLYNALHNALQCTHKLLRSSLYISISPTRSHLELILGREGHGRAAHFEAQLTVSE